MTMTATARALDTREVPAPRLVALEGNTIAYDTMLREDLQALREAYDRKLAELRELRARVAGSEPVSWYERAAAGTLPAGAPVQVTGE
jgi:hypothetical protein